MQVLIITDHILNHSITVRYHYNTLTGRTLLNSVAEQLRTHPTAEAAKQ